MMEVSVSELRTAKCADCGQSMLPILGVCCEVCRRTLEDKRSEAREKRIIEKAIVVEWGNQMLREIDGDRYFDGPCDLVHHYIESVEEGDPINPPRYMHPCDLLSLGEHFNSENLAEWICERIHDELDSYDWLKLDEGGLAEILQSWLDAQKKFVWFEDTSKIVDLKDFWKKAIEEDQQ